MNALELVQSYALKFVDKDIDLDYIVKPLDCNIIEYLNIDKLRSIKCDCKTSSKAVYSVTSCFNIEAKCLDCIDTNTSNLFFMIKDERLVAYNVSNIKRIKYEQDILYKVVKSLEQEYNLKPGFNGDNFTDLIAYVDKDLDWSRYNQDLVEEYNKIDYLACEDRIVVCLDD